MSVTLPFQVDGLEPAVELPSRTYRLNLETGRILGQVDGLEAVEQAIHKALITPRFRCLMYNNQYGSELKQTIIAGDVTPEFVKSEIPRIVQDTLSTDGRILDVYSFAITLSGDTARITFKVSTIFGETTIEEVI